MWSWSKNDPFNVVCYKSIIVEKWPFKNIIKMFLLNSVLNLAPFSSSRKDWRWKGRIWESRFLKKGRIKIGQF